MINISQTIKNSCKADTNTHTEYIVINNQTIYIKGKLSATAYKDTTFIGTFNMKVLEFETENTTQFRNREFEYYKVIDGNAFKVGSFITTEVVDNDSKDTIKVTANDYALKFAVPYTSELDYGSGEITLYDVLEECCNQVGVELENKFIDNNSFKVDSNQFVNGELVGDVICAIAGISGNFATITNEDKLRLTFTNGTGAEQTTTIDGSTQINASGFKDIELLAKTTQNTTTGANLWYLTNGTYTTNGITGIVENGKVILNGTATANAFVQIPINVNINWDTTKTYIVSAFNPIANSDVRLRINNGGGMDTTLSSTNVSASRIPNNSDMLTNIIAIRVASGITLTNFIIYPMLEVGTTIGTYEPYTYGASPNPNYPQNIETITGRNTINVSEINIWDEQWELGTLNNSTGEKSSANNCIRSKNYIVIKSSTTYYIKTPYSAICFYDKNYQFISYIQVANQTFTTPSNANYMLFRNATSYGTTYNNDICINVSNASINGTYIPYKGNKYEINLGKNLLNIENGTYTNNGLTATMTNGVISVSGTSTATSFLYIISNKLNLKAGTYTLSANNSSSYNDGNFDLRVTNSGGSIIGRTYLNTTNNKATFTLSEDLVGGHLQVRASSGDTLDNFIITPQLEVGSTATSYSPYFEPIELCKIGDYEDKIFKTRGKNLLMLNNINLSANTTTDLQLSSNLQIGTYTFDGENISGDGRFHLYGIDENNTQEYLLQNQLTKNIGGGYSFTTTKIYKAVKIYTNVALSGKIQLEKGSTATEYEPYSNNEWYIKKAIGKVVLNGSETWVSQSYGTNSWALNNVIAVNYNANEIQVMSRKFKGVEQVNRNTNDSVIYTTSNNQVYIRNTPYTSLALAQSGMSGEPLYYVLATPTYTKIDNEELLGQLDSIKTLDLFDGINNITTNAPYFLTYLDDNVEVLEDYTNLDDKRDTQPITSVSIGTSQVEGQEAILRDENLIAQYGEHWLVINDNPFAYTLEKRQQLVGEIFNKVKGFGYSSFKSEYSYRPYLELGDKIKFRNKNGDLIDSAILRYNFDFDNCTFEAPSITSATIDYELSPDPNEKAKRAEIIANQADASITAITQELQIDEDGNSQVIESIKTTQTQNSLDIEAITSYQEIDGERVLTGVKTGKGFTFNNSGLIIQSTDNTYKAVHNEMGDYYYDGDTPLGETTNEGSKFKNMDLYGEFRYGKDDIDDNALFVSMKFTDGTEECFGHFWNGD